MVDPFSALSLVFASMQFVLQLKAYFLERKKRKRQKQQLEQEQQQQTLQDHPTYVSAMTHPTPTITYYCISTYNLLPAHPNYYHHMQPAPTCYPSASPLPMSLPFYYHSTPASYSPSVDMCPTPAFNNVHAGAAVSSYASYSYSIDITPTPAVDNVHRGASVTRYTSTPSYDWLGLLEGRMELHSQQQAPIKSYYAHGSLVGVHTGASAYNDRVSCYQHWKSLQEVSTQWIQSSIAVVDWSRGNIDMFMKMEGGYFRNYRISRCDVAMFAHLLKVHEVFSGEIKKQKLERFNKKMEMVEIRGLGVQSTNSWRNLGINDESEDMADVVSERGSFVKMVRGAVFGLVCCLYEAPSNLKVDVESTAPNISTGILDIVRITTHTHLPGHIVKRDACIFSVFSFCDRGWAAQDILLG